MRKCSAKSTLFGLAELKCISQSTCRFCSYPFARLSWLFRQLRSSGAQRQLYCTSYHHCQGFTIAGPALEHVLSTNRRTQYATAFRQTLFWNAGGTLLFSYQYCQIYFTNNINPDFNPLPSPLSSTLPRGLSHSLAPWELLTMRDNRL